MMLLANSVTLATSGFSGFFARSRFSGITFSIFADTIVNTLFPPISGFWPAYVIIDRETFDRVKEMKKERSNIEFDEYGNKVRKSTHYSMKRSDNKNESPPTEKV